MKRNLCSIFIMAVLLITGGSAFAQGSGDTDPMKGMGDMKGHHMGMCPMHGMMGKELVATQDGGVVVLLGDTMTKYDKDLNKVKEVKIEINMQHMQEMMKKMHQQCPGGSQMMHRGGQPTDRTGQGQTGAQ